MNKIFMTFMQENCLMLTLCLSRATLGLEQLQQHSLMNLFYRIHKNKAKRA